MMRIRIEIGFSFKRELPDDYRELELPDGADIALALRTLAERFPGVRVRVFTGSGEIRRDVSVLLNGTNAARRDGVRTRLADGDRLTLLPPVGGG
jgi:sulfur-carrier protein